MNTATNARIKPEPLARKVRNKSDYDLFMEKKKNLKKQKW